jgi:hypothetical protein
MKTLYTFLPVFIILAFANVLFAAEPSDDGFVSIFNGKDLTNWEGQPDGWFVADGCIVGESTPEKPCKQSHYLYYTGGDLSNFHFKTTLRLQGNGNSGVQFRSEKRPNWDTFGYQADLDASQQWTGCLYHHTRAAVVKRGFDNVIDPDGKVHEKKFTDVDPIKFYKPNDWNDYEVIANGSVITLIINGQMMCRVDDRNAKDAPKTGVLALQMHQGPPMKVEFKNIKLKKL